ECARTAEERAHRGEECGEDVSEHCSVESFQSFGMRALTHCFLGPVLVWDLAHPESPRRRIEHNVDTAPAWSADGRWLGTVQRDVASLWDLQSGDEVSRVEGAEL